MPSTDKLITLDEIIKEELKNQEFAEHYQRELMINAIAKLVGELRHSAHLTQKELAKKAGTTQPVIARIESGRDSRVHSLELLARIATAGGKHINISFE